MKTNKNGIPVSANQTRKENKRQPLECALDLIEFYQKIDGIVHTIVVPRFSHLKRELQKDGWRLSK